MEICGLVLTVNRIFGIWIGTAVCIVKILSVFWSVATIIKYVLVLVG